MQQIKPHGGQLVNRVVDKKIDTEGLPKINVDDDSVLEIEKIATGVFSPLEGFMCHDDYINVLNNKRLSNNLPWTIPIILPSNDDVKEGQEYLLINNNKELAVLYLEDKYEYDKKELARKVYATEDINHPGVKKVFEMPNYLLGGKIDVLEKPTLRFGSYDLTPKQTREIFRENNWKTIAGFQTRNVPHRAHEYLQKIALEIVDGLLIHPLIGWKKKGDFSPEAILRSYEVLIKNYYPKNRVVLAALTTAMRYAGPREAIFHAIIRKNYGCTHFIVGRDHAGVGNYYGKYDAHKIFDEFEDLDIKPLLLCGPYYCKKCKNIVTEKICPHDDKIDISGTDIRDCVGNGKKIPKELMRPEVAKILTKDDLID